MVEFKAMRSLARILLAGVLFSLVYIPMAWAGGADNEEKPARPAAVDREAVADTLAVLTAGDEYRYDRAVFEDPAWVLWLQDWVRRLDRRWSSSPLLGLHGSYSVVGAVLAAFLIIGAAGLLLVRLMGAGWSAPGLAGQGNQAGEFGGSGAWGEESVRRAIDLASSGRLREAASALFRSLLQGLDGSGWIRYRSGWPSRGYLRQLRRSDDLYPLFRDFLARFELAYYSQPRPSDDDWRFLFGVYENLADAASTIRPPSYMHRQ